MNIRVTSERLRSSNQQRRFVFFAAASALIFGVFALWLVHKRAVNRQKFAEDLKSCRVAAQRGDAEAEFNMGRLYDHGIGVSQDYSEAARWYRMAAVRGYPAAEVGLGFFYSHGLGVAKDKSLAVTWYRSAAEQGYVTAQYNLGIMYFYGEGVPQDRKTALLWFRKAAGQGNTDAQRILGSGSGKRISFFPFAVLLICAILILGPILPRKGSSTFQQRLVSVLLGVSCLSYCVLSVYEFDHSNILAPVLAHSLGQIKMSFAGITIALVVAQLLVRRRRSVDGPSSPFGT